MLVRGLGTRAGGQPLPVAAPRGCICTFWAAGRQGGVPARVFWGRAFLRRLLLCAQLPEGALLLAELGEGREWCTALNAYCSLWLALRHPEDLTSLYTGIFSCEPFLQSLCNFCFGFFQSRALFPALRHAFHFRDVRWSVINWQYVQEQRGDEVHFNETNSTG